MFNNKLNILLIEDNPRDALLIDEFLLESYCDKYFLEHTTCLSDGLKKLENNEYDIILLDLGLPDSTGLNSIGLINSKAGSAPITILSGLEDEQTALKALQLGAQDYFIKGQIDSRSFTRSVRYAIERKKTAEKISRLNEQLELMVEKRTSDLKLANENLQVEIVKRSLAEKELQLLYTIIQSISETGNFDDAMNMALQKICEAAGWSIGEVWIPDKENTTLSLRAGYGCNNEKLRTFIEESRNFKFSSSIGMPGRTWSSKEPIWICDVTKDSSFIRAEIAEKAGLKTAISLPVFSGDDIVAIFNFFLSELREKNEQDLRRFTAITSQMGSVIHRRLAEEKILQGEEQYRKLFENMSGALVYGQMIYNEDKPNDFIFLNVNSAFERLTGFRNVVGKKASELFLKIDTTLAQILSGLASVASGGKPLQMELFLELIGEWTLVSVYSPQRDFFISIFDIITPRKEREEQIRIEKQRLNSIINISHSPEFSTRELFDYALQEAISLSSSEIGYLYHYNDEQEEFTLHSWSKETMKECHIINPSIRYQLNQTGLWGEAVRQKMPVIINDYSAPNKLKKGLPGGHAPLKRFMTVPIFNKGRIVAVAGVANKKTEYTEFDAQQFTLIMTAIWEIGEHKKVEAELEKYRLHLELLIDERTNELTATNELLQEEIKKQREAEEKVKDALAREKELSELKSRFVSMISHEYRTPLTAILSSTELLELYGHKWTEDKKKEHLDKIKNSVNYMTEMLKDVLLINRAEAGRLEFNPDNLELVSYCRNLVKEIQLIAGTKCLIVFNSNVESLNTFLDKRLIQYIFNNLLINAVNYSIDNGEIRFEIFASDEKLTFSVKDNGIGIPEEDIVRLFEQFYRGKNTTNIPGTGLGLSIVKRCVELHNGTIKVESRVGAGTVFTVVIPRIDLPSNLSNLN
ncbi:MAG: GAF domain-containing protein [Syntrophothermus sp.]